MPVRNGAASEDAPDRQRNVGALCPELAAAVPLLVLAPEVPRDPVLAAEFPLLPAAVLAPLVVVLPPLALERAPPDSAVVDDVPLLLGTDPVPVLTTAPMPCVEPLELWGTLETAVVPVVIAPGPLTVPAEAAPPTAAPEEVPPVGFVLVSVVLPGAAFGFCAGTGVWLTSGKFTTPLPTWPAPPLPGVGPRAAGSPDCTCCAAAGSVASERIAAKSNSLIFWQREGPPRVPGCWPCGKASATVAAVGKARRNRAWPRRWVRRPRRW